jgi:GMP synthase-like glutamine amidotransferase
MVEPEARRRVMRVRVFQHVPFEGIGSIQGWLDRRGFRPSFTRFHAGDAPPPVREYDVLIVIGCPMSVNDGARFPWLDVEMKEIARAIDAGRRVLGICLGAQLIAGALGARVYANGAKEIGWFPVFRTGPSRTAEAFPERSLVFHWHGDTFELPRGAVSFLSSHACEHQAFQLGDTVLGLQFHLETTMESARALIENCREDLAAGTGVQGAEEITSSPPRFAAINNLMDAVLDAHVLRAMS